MRPVYNTNVLFSVDGSDCVSRQCRIRLQSECQLILTGTESPMEVDVMTLRTVKEKKALHNVLLTCKNHRWYTIKLKFVSFCSQPTNTVLLQRVLEGLRYLKPRWKAVRAHRPAGGESSVHSLLTKCPSTTMCSDRPHLSVYESLLSDISAEKSQWTTVRIVGMYIHVETERNCFNNFLSRH